MATLKLLLNEKESEQAEKAGISLTRDIKTLSKSDFDKLVPIMKVKKTKDKSKTDDPLQELSERAKEIGVELFN